MAAPSPRLDPRSLEIKTKSVEQTLVPLVSQITILVNHKEKCSAGKAKSDKVTRTVMKIGAAVQGAVERFVTVGETIADENPDIQPEMYDACHEARSAGGTIASLATISSTGLDNSAASDKHVLVRAARQLLSSVTRVLLLADRVVVKQILKAEDKVAYSLTRLENTTNFTEFVKIFTQFGGEMVDLAHRTGDRQHDLKSEKRRAQIQVARSILEKFTMLLLTSSKCLLRHPDCESASQARNGVFRAMRTALQLIGLCVSDGVMPFDPSRYFAGMQVQDEEPLDIGIQLSANIAIRQFTDTLEMVRMTSAAGPGVRERLSAGMDAVGEMAQDFTDSAYTPHHHREQILDFLEEAKLELSNLLKPIQEEKLLKETIDSAALRLSKTLKDLRKELQIVAMDQVADVFRANEDHVVLNSIKTCSVAGDIEGVEHYIEKFREHSEHMQEVCRLLHHISLNDSLHVLTGHSERNLRALAPLTVLSGRTLCLHPSSRIARENLEIFCDTWAQAVNELSVLAKDSDAACHGRVAAEKQSYMSLPKPGVTCRSVHDSSSVCGGEQTHENAFLLSLRRLIVDIDSPTTTMGSSNSIDSDSGLGLSSEKSLESLHQISPDSSEIKLRSAPADAKSFSGQKKQEMNLVASLQSSEYIEKAVNAFDCRVSLLIESLASEGSAPSPSPTPGPSGCKTGLYSQSNNQLPASSFTGRGVDSGPSSSVSSHSSTNNGGSHLETELDAAVAEMMQGLNAPASG